MINIIGLLDYDYLQSTSTSIIIPNLEIMKLATYYKTEENQFCRLLTLEEQELDTYEKIYFFSETGKKLLVPEQFLRANNVIFGGSAFTNGKYIPFDNEIIDYTIPRIAVYKEFLKQKYDEGIKTKTISHTLDDTYYRNYAGKNKLPIPPIIPKKRVYLFDRDFFYPDWQYTIEKISYRKPSGIYRIHPIICNKLSQFFDVRAQSKIARSNEIILDLEVPTDEISYMIKHFKNQFLADIVLNSKVYIPLKSKWITKDKYYKELIYTLNLLYSFWANNIPIRIYLVEPKIGVQNPLYELEKAISQWTALDQHKKKSDKTLIDRMGNKKILKDQYTMITTAYPEADTLFKQSYNELVKRGYWRI